MTSLKQFSKSVNDKIRHIYDVSYEMSNIKTTKEKVGFCDVSDALTRMDNNICYLLNKLSRLIEQLRSVYILNPTDTGLHDILEATMEVVKYMNIDSLTSMALDAVRTEFEEFDRTDVCCRLIAMRIFQFVRQLHQKIIVLLYTWKKYEYFGRTDANSDSPTDTNPDELQCEVPETAS